MACLCCSSPGGRAYPKRRHPAWLLEQNYAAGPQALSFSCAGNPYRLPKIPGILRQLRIYAETKRPAPSRLSARLGAQLTQRPTAADAAQAERRRYAMPMAAPSSPTSSHFELASPPGTPLTEQPLSSAAGRLPSV